MNQRSLLRCTLLAGVASWGAACSPADPNEQAGPPTVATASVETARVEAPAADAEQDPDEGHVEPRGDGSLDRVKLEREDDPECMLDTELAHIDPTLDGFETEVLNSTGGAALKHLVVGLTEEIPAAELEELVAPEFECEALRTPTMRTRFTGDGFSIREGVFDDEVETYAGREGLALAMRDLGAPFDGQELKTKVKIVRIGVESEAVATTEVMFLAMGTGDAGHVQQNARWAVTWDVRDGYEHPRLLRIDVEQFEENTVPSLLFSDCTASAFPDAATQGEIQDGIHAWWGRIDAGMGFSLYGDYTMALGDIDGDGLDDMYVCQPGGLPNRLFRHEPDGTLTDISAAAGVDLLDDSPSALIADFDNDGHQDLVVSTLLAVNFWRGDGRGGFTRVGLHPTDNTLSLSAADYDGDGLLDIYVCRYSKSSRGTGSGTLYDSDDGKPNVLLRNLGGFEFRDVTAETGMNHNNGKFSFAGVWEDFDDDGDLDLYVANDFGRNNLYRNDGGRFRDVAGDAGAEDMAAGMGATWADYDLDGDMDLYVSNMFSSAGGRIVDKPIVQEIAGAGAIAPLQRFAKGNTLLENQGDGTFTDVSFGAGITMGRWSWGGEFLDINNDGWQDIAVPNGFVTNTDSSDL